MASPNAHNETRPESCFRRNVIITLSTFIGFVIPFSYFSFCPADVLFNWRRKTQIMHSSHYNPHIYHPVNIKRWTLYHGLSQVSQINQTRKYASARLLQILSITQAQRRGWNYIDILDDNLLEFIFNFIAHIFDRSECSNDMYSGFIDPTISKAWPASTFSAKKVMDPSSIACVASFVLVDDPRDQTRPRLQSRRIQLILLHSWTWIQTFFQKLSREKLL